MSLYIYDSLKREKVELRPGKSGRIEMYTCGPTVYNYAHIGNLRTFVFEDLLRRTIQFAGYDVYQVMNLTDVDDKTIEGALKNGQKLDDYTKTYKDAFFADLETLRVDPADAYPAATDYVEQMISLIADLLAKEYAYVADDGNVFFRIGKFGSYGKLTHLCPGSLKEGASNRVTGDEYDKESLSDFVLWKAYNSERDGEVYWEAPWGKGRPGWHIECSAMAMHLLGKTIDLHVGGVDNMFPHHENEIAQSEASTGCEFSRHWMHAAHLLVEGKKMSKSLGNFYTLRDLLDKGYTGRQIRYVLISAHYRTQLNFTFEGLDAAKSALNRIDDVIYRLKELKAADQKEPIDDLLQGVEKQFKEAMQDDLNISEALAALFEFVRSLNTLLDGDKLSVESAQKALQLFDSMDLVLGIIAREEEEIPVEVYEAAQKRWAARKEKDWATADEMREFVTAKGYFIEDTGSGFKIKKS